MKKVVICALVFLFVLSGTAYAMTYEEFIGEYPNEFIYKVCFPNGYVNYFSSPVELEFSLSDGSVQRGKALVVGNPTRATIIQMKNDGSVRSFYYAALPIMADSENGIGFEGDIDIYRWSGMGFLFVDRLYIAEGPGWTDPDDTPGWFWDSISDAISSAIDGLLQALSAPFVVIGNALDAIGEGIGQLASRVWAFFREPLEDIWNEIVSLPSRIFAGVQDILTFLFVPSEGYFAEKFGEVRASLTNKLGVDGGELDYLESADGVDLKNLSFFEGTIYGQNVKFVDMSFWDSIKPRIHSIARGFIYPLLGLYNMNQIYFLIRGVNLFGKGNGGKEE